MELSKNCVVCGKKYIKNRYVSKVRWSKSKYCSQKCCGISNIGHTPPVSAFKPGHKPWNKGGRHSPKTIAKLLIINRLNKKFGDEHHNWKGEKAKYAAIHMWVTSHKKKPKYCTKCKKKKNTLHWANKDHKYKRDLDDYTALCPSCHKKHDLEKGIAKH